MGSTSKCFTVILITAMAISSLSLMIKATCAQVGVTNPAIPGFQAVVQTYLHYIPPTYGVDPSTGKAIMTKAGYTEVEKWVDVNIGGQPFVPYKNSAGQHITLTYEVTWKGNHDTSWQTTPQGIYFGDAGDYQSTGCLISLGFKGINGGAEGYMQLLDSTDTQIDFQVQALIGYYNSNDIFVGQSSGWSNTQTVNYLEVLLLQAQRLHQQTKRYRQPQLFHPQL
jgi:hypothetical protein